MTLHQLAKSIVASLWHNSIEQFRIDGIVKNYEKPPESLSEFLNEVVFRERINFYPGDQGGDCAKTAVFMSITKTPPRAEWLKPKDKVNLQKMIPKVIQHMQGGCIDKTQKMLLITDNMNTDLINPWRGNLKNIQSRDGKEVVILFVDPKGELHDMGMACGLSIF
jgi:hypothetical protein